MFKPLPIFIGLRYTRAKRRNSFISFISLISMLGIALSVAALIAVLSVANGFEKTLRDRMLGMTPHIELFSAVYPGVIDDWRMLETIVKQEIPQAKAISPYIEGQGMLVNRRNVQGVFLRGILPELETRFSPLAEHIKTGSASLQPGENGVLIGQSMAETLDVEVGDKVTLFVPQGGSAAAAPRMKRMHVVGIFQFGLYEFDTLFVLLHADDAAPLFDVPAGQMHVLNVKLDNPDDAIVLSAMLAERLPAGYRSYDWTHRHKNFFVSIQMSKLVMGIILVLLVAVAGFNIISTLVMVVSDKEGDIAILRTLGATPRLIMQIFMVQGTLIGIIGTALGVVIGVLLALNVEWLALSIEQAFNFQFIDASIYFIDSVPSDL
ncbi:MAG: lipoprotein-releasing ABC transporter permease subunit, partial [Pseudomonadota bacterium]